MVSNVCLIRSDYYDSTISNNFKQLLPVICFGTSQISRLFEILCSLFSIIHGFTKGARCCVWVLIVSRKDAETLMLCEGESGECD